MSIRCLICGNTNPCGRHSGSAQDSELARNDAVIASIRRRYNAYREAGGQLGWTSWLKDPKL